MIQLIIVGSNATDAASNLFGSARADVILGRGGNDIIGGGDNGSLAWANDRLYGGSGNDTMQAGYGYDLMHEGDRQLLSSPSANLALDGVDTANYAMIVSNDPSKGVKIVVDTNSLDNTWSNESDFFEAVFVYELAPALGMSL